jgi:hypothetical protein
MRQLIITFVLLARVFTVLGQNNIVSADSTVLGPDESVILNNYFQEERGTFDFTDKRICFVSGSSGTKFISKQDYFDNVSTWKADSSRIVTSLVILTETERSRSGGFDAIVTAWVKVLTDKRRKKIVEVLGSES